MNTCDCCKNPAEISLADSHICQACFDTWLEQEAAKALTPAQQMAEIVRWHHQQRKAPCSTQS